MMITLAPGTYVVAVSGGVDSVVLLHLLKALSEQQSATGQPGLRVRLVIAHFDHGMRSNSQQDRAFVQQLATRYHLPCVFDEGQLGANASEAVARQARYAFLRKVMKASGAKAIITAHHLDDVLETAILNMIRGTSRRGLASLRNRADIQRPLLGYSKQAILAYAKANQLDWREDSTNADETHLRNYIRRQIMPKFGEVERAALHGHIKNTAALNDMTDSLLAEEIALHTVAGELDRRWFIGLPHNIAVEVMASWLRQTGITNYTKQLLDQLTVRAKTLRVGKRVNINRTYDMKINHQHLALERLER